LLYQATDARLDDIGVLRRRAGHDALRDPRFEGQMVMANTSRAGRSLRRARRRTGLRGAKFLLRATARRRRGRDLREHRRRHDDGEGREQRAWRSGGRLGLAPASAVALANTDGAHDQGVAAVAEADA
jgi:hypothetical protein